MKVKIARWGKSLAVRIPREIADRAGLVEGASVEIETKNDSIELRPAPPRYGLEDLLAGMTPRKMHVAYDWDSDRGEEVIDE